MAEGHGLLSTRFGVFELDLSTHELRKRGLRVKLQRQPLQLLRVLLKRPGELVTRADLRKTLWPDKVFLDFEHELNKALAKLRLALDDDARNPRFIETHFGEGYRFIAPVQTNVVEPSARTAETLRIAVLPFVAPASNPEQENLAEVLTRGTIIQLVRLYPDRLRVIAWSSVLRYYGTTKTLADIGKELGVSYALTGATRRAGARILLTVELVHAEDEVCLWGQSISREVTDPFSFQEEIVQDVAESLGTALRPDRLTAHEQSRSHAYAERRGTSHIANPLKVADRGGLRKEVT